VLPLLSAVSGGNCCRLGAAGDKKIAQKDHTAGANRRRLLSGWLLLLMISAGFALLLQVSG
jgi:hypothetical protein